METINILNSTLQISDYIVLTNKEGEASKGALTLLKLLSLFSIIIPIVVLTYLLQLSAGLPLGFFVSCIIFMLAFCYFMRLYLWNKYGKEVFIIDKNSFVVYYDYKYFKDNYRKYHCDTISILVEYNQKLQKINPLMTDSISQMEDIYIAFLINNNIIKSKSTINTQIVLKMVKYMNTMYP